MHGCGPSARQVIVEQRWSKDVFVYTAHGINTLVREIGAGVYAKTFHRPFLDRQPDEELTPIPANR
jgi:hypothetical protein